MVARTGTRNPASPHSIEARVRYAIARLATSPPIKNPRPTDLERRKGWIKIGENLSIRRSELANAVTLSNEGKTDGSDKTPDRSKSEPG